MYKQVAKPFRNLKPSENVESIFYADMFRIKNKTWLILGEGKSKAAKLASDDKPEADLSTDSSAIIRKGNTLYAGFDSGGINPNAKGLHDFHKVDLIAYCLSAPLTRERYRDAKLEITGVSNTLVANLLIRHPYAGSTAKQLFSAEQVNHLINPKRIHDRFVELTKMGRKAPGFSHGDISPHGTD